MVLAESEQAATEESPSDPDSSFDWFEGGARGARAFATCSLTKSGSMTLNDVAVQALGDPPAVRIGYNAERSQIGLRAALKNQTGAVALRPTRAPDGRETGSRSLYARSVLQYYDLLPAENSTFRLEDIGGGVHALSLGKPLPRSRANRRTANQ